MNFLRKMLENDKYNQTLSPRISILVSDESNETNGKLSEKSHPEIIQTKELFFSIINHNSNQRKCLSRLNLNEIKNELKISRSYVKEFNTPLKPKFLPKMNGSSLLLSSDPKNKSSQCLDEKKNFLNFNRKFLQLSASNSNFFKSSNSLNALDLDVVETFSIGSLDRCSFYSFNSTKDLNLDNSDLNRACNQQIINDDSKDRIVKKCLTLDKVKNWLEKI